MHKKIIILVVSGIVMGGCLLLIADFLLPEIITFSNLTGNLIKIVGASLFAAIISFFLGESVRHKIVFFLISFVVVTISYFVFLTGFLIIAWWGISELFREFQS